MYLSDLFASNSVMFYLTVGFLVLGNDQDCYGDCFDPTQNYHGNLTGVNIWDRVLTEQELSPLTKSCLTGEGNVLKWSQVMDKERPENVDLICNRECV